VRFQRLLAFPIDQWWFRWGLVARLAILFALAHVYDVPIFQDASNRLIAGQGVYAPFTRWLAQHGEGYFAYPPLYAYMLWVSGRAAAIAGSHWLISQVLIKSWMLLADLGVFTFLQRKSPAAARTYWSLWIVPLVAIGYAQPDLWVGLALAAAYGLARQERWTGVGLLLAAGIGLKMTPLLVVPFLGILLVQTRRWRGLWQMTAALTAGLAAVWVPYTLVFPDALEFVHIVEYHLTRPPVGLTALSGLRLLGDALWGLNALAGPHPWGVGTLALGPRQLDVFYTLAPHLGLALLAALALVRQWGLARAFALPLLAFLLLNRIVNEQYLLQVLPLLLLIAPGIHARLMGPYVLYVFAAGTPLRFFPPQYGLPLLPEMLLPEPLRSLGAPWFTVALAAATGVATLVFTVRLSVVAYALWRGDRPTPRLGRSVFLTVKQQNSRHSRLRGFACLLPYTRVWSDG